MVTSLSGSLVNVWVEVDGVAQTIYRRPRDNQPFIEAVVGTPYVVLVQNLTGGRVELLVSVDGQNSLQEEEANYLLNGGMVIGGYATYPFRGWQVDDNTTGQFVFKDPTLSIAALSTGKTSNVGVIGVAVYEQYSPRVTLPVRPTYQSREMFSLGDSVVKDMQSGGDVGTGMGELLHNPVGRTSFRRRTDKPAEVISIRYATYQWLEQHGILVPNEPQAFPGNYTAPGQTGYGKYTSGLR